MGWLIDVVRSAIDMAVGVIDQLMPIGQIFFQLADTFQQITRALS